MKGIVVAGLIGLLVLGAWGSAQQFRSRSDDSGLSGWQYGSGELGTMFASPGRHGMMGRGMMGGMGPGMPIWPGIGGGMMTPQLGTQKMMDFCRREMGDWSPSSRPAKPSPKIRSDR